MKYELNDRDLWWEIKDTDAGYTHIAYPSELVSDVLRAMIGEIRNTRCSVLANELRGLILKIAEKEKV